jgi:hypothetical protein
MGKEYSLAALLERWGLSEQYHTNMTPAWRCQLATMADTEAGMAAACLAAEPLLVPEVYGERVQQAVGGDALEYVQRDEWNQFPKPRIAMTSGWGAPGTRVVSHEFVTLVESFSEVLHCEKVVNLQLFHREDPCAPRLPRLPELLDWPLKCLLDGEDGKSGVKCDMATRVSKRGALTWWHLDDSGEFVLQVRHSILPLRNEMHFTGQVTAVREVNQFRVYIEYRIE